MGGNGSIEDRISRWRTLIEDTLETLLPPAEDAPTAPGIHNAMRRSVLGGGHRYRPILVLSVAESFGGNIRPALLVAAVVELVHSASMILDDLPSFDNADTRHGQPACHKLFGEYVAILATHRIASLCVEINWRMRREVNSPMGDQIEHEYTRLINSMISGEALDLKTKHQELTYEALIDIYTGKSATLFSFAAAGGGIVSGATADEIEMLRSYGLAIGVAYQILDDIYDVQGGPGTVGKATGMDARNGKATTYPILAGLENSIRSMNAYKEQALEILHALGPRSSNLLAMTNLILPNVRVTQR